MPTSSARAMGRFIPVSKLFAKIFFWFLLSMWGVHTMFLMRVYFSGIHVVKQPNMYATVAPILAAEAVRVYESGGPQAFARFSQTNIDDREKEVYLLDGFYNDVLHRKIPANGLRTAHAARDGQMVVLGGQIAAFKLTGPSGRPYILLLFINKKLEDFREILFGEGSPVLVGFLILVPLLCLLLAYHIAAPIHAIQNAARRVARGDLSARAPSRVLRRHDELAALAVDFNAMVERLQILLGGHKNILASVSHELRSPLARLNVCTALLRRGTINQHGELLDRMDRDISLIDTLMGQLLTLSRLEAGISGTHLTRVDLTQLVEQVGADGNFEAAASGKSVQVFILAPAVLPAGDPHAIRSACENILRNAIRYTPAGTVVEINLGVESSSDMESAVLSIRDHGPGVPEAMLESIFKPFVRVASDAMTGGNNGLGLAIVAGAVQLHRGEVFARNHPDGGLVVTMRLPLDAAGIEDNDSSTIPAAYALS